MTTDNNENEGKENLLEITKYVRKLACCHCQLQRQQQNLSICVKLTTTM